MCSPLEKDRYKPQRLNTLNSEVQLRSGVRVSASLQQTELVLPADTVQPLSFLVYLVFVTTPSAEIADEVESESGYCNITLNRIKKV